MAEGLSAVGLRVLAALCAALPALLWPQGLACAAGGGTWDDSGVNSLLALLTLLAAAAVTEYLLGRKHRAVWRELARWARRDPSWEPRRLEGHVRKTLSWIQEARRRQDLATLHVLLHPDLYREWEAEIARMRSEGVTEVLKGPRLLRVRLVGARDRRGDQQDSFTALVTFRGARYRVDSRGVVLDRLSRQDVTRPDAHEEYGTYQCQEDRWLLRDVAGAGGLFSLLVGMAGSAVSEEAEDPA